MAADDHTESERIERALEGVNAGYIAEMQERWQADPASVDPEWRALFEPAIAPATDGQSASAPPTEAASPASEAAPQVLPPGATPVLHTPASGAAEAPATVAPRHRPSSRYRTLASSSTSPPRGRAK